ncbi:GpE family phage tail protein [Delftia sp. ZNC0008]|jgi:hypothetical protein|nr:GpE family phage tail protein [Delftia sp. ZNC0008]KAA9181543.1 GpE family phage tail protein [Delftia sp. BR1]
MTDLAMVFHWPPSAMYAMEMDELIDWRERAVKRWNEVHAPPNK